MTDLKVVHAYRHLYRACMHAVQFSKPARFVARDKLRAAFREKGARLDERGANRTLRFLEAAARERGPEHKVLKNLLLTTYFRHYQTVTRYKNLYANEQSKNNK